MYELVCIICWCVYVGVSCVHNCPSTLNVCNTTVKAYYCLISITFHFNVTLIFDVNRQRQLYTTFFNGIVELHSK